jgi:hypothetical protein
VSESVQEARSGQEFESLASLAGTRSTINDRCSTPLQLLSCKDTLPRLQFEFAAACAACSPPPCCGHQTRSVEHSPWNESEEKNLSFRNSFESVRPCGYFASSIPAQPNHNPQPRAKFQNKFGPFLALYMRTPRGASCGFGSKCHANRNGD